MYRLYAAISIIIGMYLDSVLFAKVNIAGVVPDCVLVVIVCMGIQLGATEAAAVGCAAGLVIDIRFCCLLWFYYGTDSLCPCIRIQMFYRNLLSTFIAHVHSSQQFPGIIHLIVI